jgi:hypothetical protein
MTGSLGMRGATLTYDETMVQGGQTILASEATCSFDGAPPAPSYAPPPAAVYAPRPQATSNQVFVPLNSASSARSQAVNVTVGSTPVSMTIDSGCDTMALSPAFAEQLIAQGEASVIGTVNLSLAASQHQVGRKLIVDRVQIGDRVLTDVLANDGGADDSMLLTKRARPFRPLFDRSDRRPSGARMSRLVSDRAAVPRHRPPSFMEGTDYE